MIVSPISNLTKTKPKTIRNWNFLNSTFSTLHDKNLHVVKSKLTNTVDPVYNGHPWDPKIEAFVHRCLLSRAFSIKIAIEFDLVKLRLAVVGRWPLLRGGR